jgi:hypothetical protein
MRGRPKIRPCIKCKEMKKSPQDFNAQSTLYCLICKPNQGYDARPTRSRKVNLSKELNRLLTCLHQDTNELMRESALGRLSADSARSLVAYVKLVSDIRAQRMLEEVEQPKEVTNAKIT